MKKTKKFVHVVIILDSKNDLSFVGCFESKLKAQTFFEKTRTDKCSTKYTVKVELE